MGGQHGGGGSEKTAVALSSALASGAMTALKFAVGFATGSLGILSEATKSALDFLAAIVTWVAVRIAERPDHPRHSYGHGKAENISSLIATLLLLGSGLWILYEAVLRLIGGTPPPTTPWYAVAILILSIAVDFSRSRALSKVARETGSQALEADALHFFSDMFTSGAVLVGLGFVFFGFPAADSVAALVVAGFVTVSGLRMLAQTVAALVDTAPDGVIERLAEIAGADSAVQEVVRVRARSSGGAIFADLEITVESGLTIAEGEVIRRRLSAAMIAAIPRSDIALVLRPGSPPG